MYLITRQACLSHAIKGLLRTGHPSSLRLTAGENGFTLHAQGNPLWGSARCAAQIGEKGQVIVPAGLFHEAVCAAGEGDVQLYLEGDSRLILAQGARMKTTFLCQAGSAATPPPAREQWLTLSPDLFSALVEGGALAAGQHNELSMQTRISVQDDCISVASTDGYRLSQCRATLRGASTGELLVPLELLKAALASVDKHPVTLGRDGNCVWICVGDLEFSSPCERSRYPVVEDIFLSGDHVSTTLDTDAFYRACGASAGAISPAITLKLDSAGTRVSASDDQRGDVDCLLASYVQGGETSVRLNARLLLPALRIVSSLQVAVAIPPQPAPVYFYAPGAVDFTYVMMPLA